MTSEGFGSPDPRAHQDRAERSTGDRAAGGEETDSSTESEAGSKEGAASGTGKPSNGGGAKAPSVNKLIPGAPEGNQSWFSPSPDQMGNACTIVKVGRGMDLPPRATVIAVATSLQEAKLTNLGHLGNQNDHDSQGLFQQRPSAGWGTPEEITDPKYAAKAFYSSLKSADWENQTLAQAAQSVQVSAYPFEYAQWEEMAATIVKGCYGAGKYADVGK
ncbi:MAG: hypothetical protein ACRDTQ_16165 [Micromonosporaceae bacterium]